MKSLLYFPIFLLLVLFMSSCGKEDNPQVIRNDNAWQLTHSNGKSAQNPCFSPDGQYLVFTRFLDGYNEGPSEIVKIRVDGTEEQLIVSASNAGNVTVPAGCWVGSEICFASDRAGLADEIWLVNDDGTKLRQITTHPESGGIYYIEPVFNPQNSRQIVFEYVTGENDATAIHQIAFLNVSTGEVTLLTDGSRDDRLPGWSRDGKKILFQRNEYGHENGWKVYTADIDTSDISLSDITAVNSADIDQTDCSWYYDDCYILTSSYFDGSMMPNIFLLPVDEGSAVRITNTSTNEDGAPACSPDGQKIAFESHYGEDEEFSSEIWIIKP